MNNGDGDVGKLQIRIDLLDGRVTPVSDIAEKNVRQQPPGEAHLTRFDTFDMYDRDDATDDQRELHHPELVQLFRLERHIARSKIDGSFLDQTDADA